MTRLTTLLSDIYKPFGNEWVKQNDVVFTNARQCGITIAGSIGIAVSRKKAIRTPGDIDFVCATNTEAIHFINQLENFLLTKSVYWRVLVNSKTSFCPTGCTAHFRFIAPFWLPICVMVIGEVNHWRAPGGNLIQKFDDMVKAAKDLDARDGRSRMEEGPDIEPIEDIFEDPDPRKPNRRNIDLSEMDPLSERDVIFTYVKQT